jgi:protoheme IX farnesyltransferase
LSASEVVAERSLLAVARDYVALTKPRLSGLVMMTAAGGMWLAGRPLPWQTWFFAMLGTACMVGAANTLNCVFERESDRFMARTAKRPLPMGRLEPKGALAFAAVLSAIALPTLWLGVNALTGFLGLVALVSYAFAYTPLKRRTYWAMHVGALPGALPPLMGWTAATGRIEAPGLALFAILALWQLPHFIAIALFRKEEYRAAGLTSLPLERGDDVARAHALGYLLALAPVSFLPSVVGVAGPLYSAAAVAMNVLILLVAFKGWRTKGDAAWARQLFGLTLVYLTVLFAALAVA